jgi:hypothetical protein
MAMKLPLKPIGAASAMPIASPAMTATIERLAAATRFK